jgi:protein-S-isoprenylcysteine O-methyltransferase Ste14
MMLLTDTLINFVSNLVIFIAVVANILFVFRPIESAIQKHPIAKIIGKFCLSLAACGAVLNMATLSTPARSEILINVGLASTFMWVAWWQYTTSKKPVKTVKRS